MPFLILLAFCLLWTYSNTPLLFFLLQLFFVGGSGFIRPGLFSVFLAGSMNRTPTLVQRQAFLVFTRIGLSILLTTNDYSLTTILIAFPPALASTLPFYFPVLKARLLSNYSPLPDNYPAHNKFYPANNKLKKNRNCI